jgi:hypothetical protein
MLGDYPCMLPASKCFNVIFSKTYLDLLDCLFSKIFACCGLCDLVDSFMAMVHLVCLMASHE